MNSRNLDITGIEELLERLENEGKTAMIMAIDGRIEGVLAVADTLKEHSKEAITELKRMGVEVWMITGDNKRTANAIAAQVGIDNVRPKFYPKIKHMKWKSLKNKRR